MESQGDGIDGVGWNKCHGQGYLRAGASTGRGIYGQGHLPRGDIYREGHLIGDANQLERVLMKMKKSEMKPYKELLLEMRAKLQGDVSAMANAALNKENGNGGGSASSVPSHIADMGSDTYEQDNTLLLMNSEGETLNAIEAALERIEKRTYGICVECNKPIPKLRLKAIPYTPYCVKCASNIQTQT